MAGQVLFVCRFSDHISQTVSKVGIIETTVLEFELETCVETNEYSRITLTTYNMCEYSNKINWENPTRCQAYQL